MKVQNRTGYDPETYWQEVAGRIAEREPGNELAGDEEPFYAFRRKQFLTRLLPKLPVEGRDVLEVGCGPGGNLRALAERNPRRLAGCDLSENMIELARRNTAGTGVEIFKSTTDALPFADHEFDVCFTVTVIHHNADQTADALIAEMSRVSRDQIVLFEITGSRADWYSFVRRPVGEYRAKLRRHGFRLTDTAFLYDHLTGMSTGVVRRVLNPRAREGQKRNQVSRLCERALVSVLPAIDQRLALRNGVLTMMTFTKDRVATGDRQPRGGAVAAGTASD